MSPSTGAGRQAWDTLSCIAGAAGPPRKDPEKVNDLVSMSPHELSRAEVMQHLKAKRMTQRQAAEQLGLTVRQVKRLWRAYRTGGAKALVSKQRGRPSNHQLDPKVKQKARALIQARYADFGPTLTHEKLTEVHQLSLSPETVRRIMIADDLWQPHRAKPVQVHPLRTRRARRGELVQIDGSPFAWFEERGPACSLLVFIDDATGQLLELFFTPAETTFSYFAATRRYLARYGRPIAFYSDKHSIFRLTNSAATSASGLTQFGRAMTELDIQIICANSPQAKGRVERANQTLQDRLVKELRLQRISTAERANAYAPDFMADFNRRFGRPPADPADAHRPLLASHALDHILTLQTPRTVTQNLTVQHNKRVYQLVAPRGTRTFRGAQLLVVEDAQGQVTLEYQGRQLAYTLYQQQTRQADVVSSKHIAAAVEAAQHQPPVTIPAANHPWRRGYEMRQAKIELASRRAAPEDQAPPAGGA
jgi:transposase